MLSTLAARVPRARRKTLLALSLACLALLAAGMAPATVLADGHEGGTGGGGASVDILLPDLSSLNSSLAANGFAELQGPFVGFGGTGGGGLRQGWSFGGFGGGGTLTSVAEHNGVNKKAQLDLSYGGGLLNYNFPLGLKVLVSGGTALGWGKAELQLSFDEPTSVDDAIARGHNTKLTAPFLMLGPQVSMQVGLFDWLAVRISAGYLYAHVLGGQWRYDSAVLPGTSAKPSFSGPVIQATVYFGK